MLFYRFYAALAGLLHGNHCYFDRCSPFFSNPIIKYTKDDTGVKYAILYRWRRVAEVYLDKHKYIVHRFEYYCDHWKEAVISMQKTSQGSVEPEKDHC